MKLLYRGITREPNIFSGLTTGSLIYVWEVKPNEWTMAQNPYDVSRGFCWTFFLDIPDDVGIKYLFDNTILINADSKSKILELL